MLSKRVISGIIAVIVVIVLLIEGRYLLALGVLAIAISALKEFINLMSLQEKVLPPKLFLFFLAFCLVAGAFWGGERYFYPFIFIALFVILLRESYFDKEGFLERSLLGWFALVYIPFFLSHLLLLRQVDNMVNPFLLTIFVLMIIWGTDTAAYYVGSFYGHNKLAAAISPKKTWEGFWGGVVFALIIGIIIALFAKFALFKAIIMILVVSIVGQLGDLLESIFKREANIKDSGSFLPGHGGLLDRIDSLLIALPVAYYFFRFFSL